MKNKPIFLEIINTWQSYYDHFDEGLGTTYERFILHRYFEHLRDKYKDEINDLTPEADGVDGSSVFIYGEGWNFGEVADNARGINATQANMAGTGIGTFNDRLRDAELMHDTPASLTPSPRPAEVVSPLALAVDQSGTKIFSIDSLRHRFSR